MRRIAVLAAFASIAAAGAAAAETTVTLTLKNHRFTPAEVTVPAGQPIRIVLINQDAATEEFDSGDLMVEEMVTPMGRTSFTVGPLDAGAFTFMGEYHPRTAQGRIIALGAPEASPTAGSSPLAPGP
jgi:plastocyanin